ncbi:hypothetical protein ACTA71_001614 [Dictyostelium dimigraforme]
MSIKSNEIDHHISYLYRSTNILTRSRVKAFVANIPIDTIKEKKSNHSIISTIERKKKPEIESMDKETKEPKDINHNDYIDESDYDQSDIDKKSKTILSNKKLVEKRKHCQVEAKCRKRRIDLYKKLQNVIGVIEEKLNHPIPLFKIIDHRRKVNKTSGKYTQEQILRKIYSTILINEKFIKKRNNSNFLNQIGVENQIDQDKKKIKEDKNENDINNITTKGISIDQEIEQTSTFEKKSNYFGLKNLLIASQIDNEMELI